MTSAERREVALAVATLFAIVGIAAIGLVWGLCCGAVRRGWQLLRHTHGGRA